MILQFANFAKNFFQRMRFFGACFSFLSRLFSFFIQILFINYSRFSISLFCTFFVVIFFTLLPFNLVRFYIPFYDFISYSLIIITFLFEYFYYPPLSSRLSSSILFHSLFPLFLNICCSAILANKLLLFIFPFAPLSSLFLFHLFFVIP